MDNSILNIEQAMDFLGVSEKTLIKLLREEHIPARKIGREWRFSKDALINWLSQGDSCNYITNNENYQVSVDKAGKSVELMDYICKDMQILKDTNNLNQIMDINKDVKIPLDASLRISYKQKRDVEKIEFKIYWPLSDEFSISTEQK